MGTVMKRIAIFKGFEDNGKTFAHLGSWGHHYWGEGRPQVRTDVFDHSSLVISRTYYKLVKEGDNEAPGANAIYFAWSSTP